MFAVFKSLKKKKKKQNPDRILFPRTRVDRVNLGHLHSGDREVWVHRKVAPVKVPA